MAEVAPSSDPSHVLLADFPEEAGPRTAEGAGEYEDGVEAGARADLHQAGRVNTRPRLLCRLAHLYQCAMIVSEAA